MSAMRSIALPDGERVPALGQGTWQMGERRREREREVASVARGIEFGLTLIDTAEMYGDGEAERIVGEAIRGRREQCFLVSKIFPHNATRAGVRRHCEASLQRLGTDALDLYLLHWRGNAALAQVVAGFGDMQRAGKIRHWGVSNFDAGDMADLWRTPGGSAAAMNQILYHLGERQPEWDLLPWLGEHGVPAMAYSPLGHGRLMRDRHLRAFTERHGMTPAQAALAWLLERGDTIAVPKTSDTERQADNRGAAEIEFTEAQRRELEALFPPPSGRGPLGVI
jgi:aldehyde reductase